MVKQITQGLSRGFSYGVKILHDLEVLAKLFFNYLNDPRETLYRCCPRYGERHKVPFIQKECAAREQWA